jgi:molybdate transport system ATP-binding protein
MADMTTELVAKFEKRFHAEAVIRGDLRQQAGQFFVTVLFGPSGCGKTTILRCLAGLERPESGTICLGEEPWFDAHRRIFRLPQERDIGYLFQDFALFPHRTVGQNIAYGIRSAPKAECDHRVGEMLERFGLNGLESRYPRQVSGGQQQRIALARVLARRPRLLLLDEPLSALDASLRESLRGELRRLLGEFDVPVVMVTHDRVEAIALADQVVVLDGGAACQSGTVHEVFARPADLAVARIVGMETVELGRIVEIKEGLATVAIGPVSLVALAPKNGTREAYVCIRAEEVMLQQGQAGPSSPRNRLTARVTSMVPEGPMVRVGLDCGFALTSLVTRPAIEEMGLGPGDLVTALLKVPAVHLIPRG